MLLYGIVGACIVGLPLVVLLFIQICSSTGLKQQLHDYEQWEQQGLYLYVWMLKKEIPAGKKITEADLEQKKIWIPESEYRYLYTDMEQITGKKAKTALKKGTVIQAGMLHQKKYQKGSAKAP